MVELGFTDEFRRAWAFARDIERSRQQRPPIDYARLGYKHKKRHRKGKR